MSNPLRVAIVGAGSISREFATRHFGAPTGTKVSCVVDVDQNNARDLARDVGSVQAGATVVGDNKYRSRPTDVQGIPVPHFPELNDAALGGCDCVYVGTPPASHAALVVQALAAKKHVILEKPIASTGSDADIIVQAAESAQSEHGIYTSLDIGMRWNAGLSRMREELKSQRIGVLREGWLRLHFRTWPREWQVQPWCAGRKEGGALREVGTHFLFGLHELFGHGCVQRVCATVTYTDGPHGNRAEESVSGVLELAAGILGSETPIPVHLSVQTRGQSDLERAGRDLYELEFSGDQGALKLFDFTCLLGPRREVLVSNAPYGRRECITELVTAVATGKPDNIVSARQARNAQRVLDAILASAGCWVNVSYD